MEVELGDGRRGRVLVSLVFGRFCERLEEQVGLGEVRRRLRAGGRWDRSSPLGEHRFNSADLVVEVPAVERESSEVVLARQHLDSWPGSDRGGVGEGCVGVLEEVAHEPGGVAVKRRGRGARVLVRLDRDRRGEKGFPKGERGRWANDVGVVGGRSDLHLEAHLGRGPFLPVAELGQGRGHVAGGKQLRSDVDRDPQLSSRLPMGTGGP